MKSENVREVERRSEGRMSVPAKGAEQNGECAYNSLGPQPEASKESVEKTASSTPSNGSAQSESVPVRGGHISRYVYTQTDSNVHARLGIAESRCMEPDYWEGWTEARTSTFWRGLSAIALICRFGTWVFSWMVPGLGMFNESYYIFSVGNVKPIWREQYPRCWKVTLLHVSTRSLLETHHSSFTHSNIWCHGTSRIIPPGL